MSPIWHILEFCFVWSGYSQHVLETRSQSSDQSMSGKTELWLKTSLALMEVWSQITTASLGSLSCRILGLAHSSGWKWKGIHNIYFWWYAYRMISHNKIMYIYHTPANQRNYVSLPRKAEKIMCYKRQLFFFSNKKKGSQLQFLESRKKQLRPRIIFANAIT